MTNGQQNTDQLSVFLEDLDLAGWLFAIPRQMLIFTLKKLSGISKRSYPECSLRIWFVYLFCLPSVGYLIVCVCSLDVVYCGRKEKVIEGAFQLWML